MKYFINIPKNKPSKLIHLFLFKSKNKSLNTQGKSDNNLMTSIASTMGLNRELKPDFP